MELKVGMAVGCSYRWPYSAAHPDCWLAPYKGVILAITDPAAWSKTLAFSAEFPDAGKVAKHVEWCLSQGHLKGSVPIRYETDSGHFVQWDSVDSLSPYADAVREWRIARAESRGIKVALAVA